MSDDDRLGPLAHFTIEEDGTLKQNVAVVRSHRASRVLVGPPGAKPGDPGWRDLGMVTMIDAAGDRGNPAAQRLALHASIRPPLPAGPDYPLPPPSGWTLRMPTLPRGMTLHFDMSPALRRFFRVPEPPPGHYLG